MKDQICHKEGLRLELSIIKNITILTNKSFKYYKYLQENRQTEVFQANEIFKIAKFTLWEVVVIELCKLFIDKANNKHNLFQLLSRMETNFNQLEYKTDISKEWIQQWKSRFLKIDNSKLKFLETLRNQLYAHTDDPFVEYLTNTSLDLTDIDFIISSSKELLVDIESKIYKTRYMFEIPIDSVEPTVLKRLSELKAMKNKELIRNLNERKTGYRRVDGSASS